VAIGHIQVPVTYSNDHSIGEDGGKMWAEPENLENPLHTMLKITSEQDTVDCSEGTCPGPSINAALIVLYSHGNNSVSLLFFIVHNSEKILSSRKLSKACF